MKTQIFISHFIYFGKRLCVYLRNYAFYGFLAALVSATVSAQEIYTYIDENGNRIISSSNPDGNIASNDTTNQGSSNTQATNELSISQDGNNITIQGNTQQQRKSLYRYVDENGKVRFIDREVPGAVKIAEFVPEPPKPKPDANSYAMPSSFAYSSAGIKGYGLSERARQYNNLIHKYAQIYNVDPKLVHAVIRAESAYNPLAVSSAGATGLMQLMPATAARFGVTNRLNPEQNIRGGVHYLSELMQLFDGQLELVLAGYNAGENAVISRGYQVPNFPETKGYIVKVKQYYQLQQALASY